MAFTKNRLDFYGIITSLDFHFKSDEKKITCEMKVRNTQFLWGKKRFERKLALSLFQNQSKRAAFDGLAAEKHITKDHKYMYFNFRMKNIILERLITFFVYFDGKLRWCCHILLERSLRD